MRGVSEDADAGQLGGEPRGARVRLEREADVEQRGDDEHRGEDVARVARDRDGDEGQDGALDGATDE